LKVTLIGSPWPPAITWLLVTIAPSADSTTPDPSSSPIAMYTTLGRTARAISETDDRSGIGTAAATADDSAAGASSAVRLEMAAPAVPPPTVSATAASAPAAMFFGEFISGSTGLIFKLPGRPLSLGCE
jgi:hypothetical protein